MRDCASTEAPVWLDIASVSFLVVAVAFSVAVVWRLLR